MKVIFACSFIVVLAVICQETSAENDVDFEQVHSECQVDHDISDSELEDLQKKATEEADIEMKFKCFIHCVIKKMGYLDENGKLDADQFLNSNETQGTEMEKISDCKAMHDMTDDPCEYVYDIYSCITA